MPQDEAWSWKKLFKGPFVGKNWAKAIVTTLIQVILIALVACIVLTVLQFKGCSKETDKTDIGTNSGVVNQTDSHSTTTITHYHLPLSDLFNWFGFRKVEKEKKE